MATYRNLPSGYTQVEYIESSGTQYIDTGMTLNQNSKVELKIKDVPLVSSMIMGSRSSATSNNFSILTGLVSGNASLVCDFQDYRNNRLSVNVNDIASNEFIIKVNNSKLEINDTSQNVSTYTNFTTPENAYIFNGSGTYPTGYVKASTKLYYCKIWQSDELVRDFVPCINSNDVVGLYDVANDVFYQNVGTGVFTAGEVVDNNEFEEECKNSAYCNRTGTLSFNELDITGENQLVDFTIESGCYDNGDIIGNTYVKKIEANLLDSLDDDLIDQTFDTKVGVIISPEGEEGYSFTREVVSGKEYLIVNSNSTDANSINSEIGNTQLNPDVAPTDNVWIFTTSGSGYTIKNKTTNKYLGYVTSGTGGSTVTLGTYDDASVWTWNSSNGRLSFTTTGLFSRTYYLRYNNGWQINTNSAALYLGTYVGKELVELPLGKFVVERPNDTQTENRTSFVGYDMLLTHLEEVYSTELDYENETITLADVYEELCDTLGLTPVTTTFTNSTLTVEGNPFTNGEKNRDVLKSIEKVSCSFVDIDPDTNKIDLKWLSSDLDYTFELSDYSTLEGGKIEYGPINSLVIKGTEIESENVSIEDSESIAEYGEHQFVIAEDYFLYDATKRQAVINDIWAKVHNLTYVDCKLTTYTGKPFLRIGNKIRVYTSENDYFDTYVLKHKFTFDGAFMSEIESPVLTQQEVQTKQDISLGDKLRTTQIIVNKQEGTITSVVGATETLGNQIQTNSTDIANLNNNLSGLDEDLQQYKTSVSTQFTQTEQDFTFQFNQITDLVDQVSDTEAGHYSELHKYIRFVNGVIILGEEGNELTAELSNTKLSFKQSGTEVAYVSNNKLYITNAEVLTQIDIGQFQFVPRNNGSLSFRKKS